MTNSAKSTASEKPITEHEEINIWLDSYDEMFSDFDPSSYTKRTISDDFVLQVRKVSQNKKQENTVLKLLLPESIRNKEVEEVISQRLHNHFILSNIRLLEEKKKTNHKGLLFTISGVSLMLLASYISFLNSETFYAHVLRILFEPAGWFMLWLGLDHLVYFPEKTKKEIKFYTRMAEAKIEFSTIG